jgi:Domain of unknown function (DUF3291)
VAIENAYQLAHLNVARMRATLDSPVMAEFVAQLDAMNAIADGAPGFVWRMVEEDANDPALIALGPLMLVNLSVWRDAQALSHYVYRSAHAGVLKERARWFLPQERATTVLWWVPGGHIPSLQEATYRLVGLQDSGPSLRAFGFRHLFPRPSGTHET